MCFSAPKAPKPAPIPTPPPVAEPLANEALTEKRKNKAAVRQAREGLKIPIGTGGSPSGGVAIPGRAQPDARPD